MNKTAKEIELSLDIYFYAAKYTVSNVYFFKSPKYHETDFLVVNKNGLIFDVEIKLSRADYKADSKKTHKHFCLSHKGIDYPVPG